MSSREEEFYTGDRVRLKNNNYRQGVMLVKSIRSNEAVCTRTDKHGNLHEDYHLFKDLELVSREEEDVADTHVWSDEY